MLSWRSDTTLTHLVPIGDEPLRLYVRLQGLVSLRGAEALLLWTPSTSADGYSLAGWEAPAGSDCNWLLRGQVLSGSKAADSTLYISAVSQLNDSCATGNVFAVEFEASSSQLPPGRFALATAKVIDANGEEDLLPTGPAATILGGFLDPAPLVATLSPMTGWVGSTVRYRLTGEYFLDGLVVSLERSGATPLLGAVERIDRSKADVRFTFTPADTGWWDLAVRNVGGVATTKPHVVFVNGRDLPTVNVWVESTTAPVVEACFEPGSLPLTGPRAVALGTLLSGDPGLIQSLSALGVQSVRCMWPESTPQPTTAMQPGGSVEPLFDFGNCFELYFDSPDAASQALGQLLDLEEVVFGTVRELSPALAVPQGHCSVASIARTCQATTIPDDENFGPTTGGAAEIRSCNQWYLYHTGCTGGTVNEDLQTVCGWNRPDARGDRAVIVGIVDSGLDVDHPDLAYTYSDPTLGKRILPGMSFINPNSPEDIADDAGHGTQMAGLAAARTGTGVTIPAPPNPQACEWGIDLGMAGVAGGWAATAPDLAGSRLLPAKVTDVDGTSSPGLIAEGINWVALNGARVINVSLSLHRGRDPEDASLKLLREALFNAMKVGATSVAAMGNFNSTESLYPARFAEWGLCIAVGASDDCGDRAEFEVIDPENPSGSITVGSSFGPHMDAVAPGLQIFTTNPSVGGALDCRQFYAERLFGSSFSTALTTGVAASLLGLNPSLRDVDLKEILRRSAWFNFEDRTQPDPTSVGWGRVDHGKAVELLDPLLRRSLVGGTLSDSEVSGITQTTITIIAADGLGVPDGTYVADQYELAFASDFAVEFAEPPATWVQVVGTKGWLRDREDPTPTFRFNYGSGETAQVTEVGAVFVTHVYFIPQLNKWVPCDPASSTLRYAALGTVAGVTAVEDRGSGHELSLRIMGTPSHSQSGVSFEVTGRPGVEVQVQIVDVAGRRVRTLARPVSSEGRSVLRWDGRDENGRETAAGVYFVRVRQGNNIVFGKTVVLQ